MIGAVKTFTTKPRNLIYAAMLSTALVAGTAQTQAQKVDKDAITQYFEDHKQDIFELTGEENEIAIGDLKDAKRQFNERMKTYTVENYWKDLNSGMSQEECEDLDKFLNTAINHHDKSVSKWAAKKKAEFEHLKASEYNQRTIDKDIEKSNSKIEKLNKRVEKIERTKDQPQNLIMFLIYGDDYRKINAINEEDIEYTKKDISYVKKLLELQTKEVLSTASVKKLKSGNGKSVK